MTVIEGPTRNGGVVLPPGATKPEPAEVEPDIPGLEPDEGPTGFARVGDAVRAFLTRYVALGDHEADALALWIIHSHAFAASETTPYIAITSNGPGTGKTRCLETLELLVANPWLTGRVTGPALVRKVAAERPTLLLDETDALFSGHVRSQEVLRGVLNSGYKLGGKASYAQGGGYVDLDVYCPKAFAGIGALPGTIADRSIPVLMRKRTAFQQVERLRRRDVRAEARVPRMLAARFANTHLDLLRAARPEIPPSLDDRAADVWEPLLAIAEALGSGWPERARTAAVALCSGRKDADTDTLAFELLAECRVVFDELGSDRLQTATLVEWLRDGGRFAELEGQPLDARLLADTLRGFGIAPKKIRFGRVVLQGYLRREFEGAWALLGDVPAVVDVPAVAS